MKVINISILLFLFAIIFASCEKAGVSGMKRGAASDYQFEVFNDVGGEKAKVGEFVYFDMSIYDDRDSLLQTYNDQKNRPAVQILDLSDENRKKNPLIDVLAEMSIGDSMALWIPRDSMQGLPPGMENVEHVEYHLVAQEIMSEEEHKARITKLQQEAQAAAEALQARRPEIESMTEQTVKDYKKGRLETKVTPLGTKYIIHELGTGPMPANGNMLSMQYFGRAVEKGNHFDDSFRKGRPFSFRLGQGRVIKGWDDAMQYFPVGTKASLFIPSELGYGERGSGLDIPGGAELYFYVEVEDMNL